MDYICIDKYLYIRIYAARGWNVAGAERKQSKVRGGGARGYHYSLGNFSAAAESHALFSEARRLITARPARTRRG